MSNILSEVCRDEIFQEIYGWKIHSFFLNKLYKHAQAEIKHMLSIIQAWDSI